MREFPNAAKRPWRQKDLELGTYSYIAADDETDIAALGECWLGGDMKANAEFIVHAVNTYEERERLLEEAAEVLRTIADAHIPDQPASFPGNELVHAQRHVATLRRAARAFLAKMEARDDA